MGGHRRRHRNLALETPSSAGDIKTAMLLYEAPSGIAIFSFDGSYLNGLAKDFWKFLPPLSLEIFTPYERVPIDFANKSIDNQLADSLTELCGSEKALVVGSAEYKKIIEMKLGITCLYVDVPGCEVIICRLKDSICNSLGFSGDPTAMLLYKAPSGIAIFSFDERYLNGLAEDFWACLPPLSLKEFMAYEWVPTPFDLDNDAIDDCLAKRLMELCCSEKKLVVGSAEHKAIIEMKLGITCLYVDIPDCEVNICSVKKPLRTLLPNEKADPVKDIMLFLRQHYFDIPDGKVDASFSAPALRLHNIELREMDYLKFLRLLLKNFMSRSGIDTKNWALIQFATALKMICYPLASYEVYHPDKIFLSDMYSKIVHHPPGCKEGFFKIDVLSVYNEVVSLCSQKCRHLYKLDFLVRKATNMKAKLEQHPSPNGFCREIYNNESKLEADNSVLGSVMGELDATSTLVKDKESEAAVLRDNVRSLQDEVTTRVIDVTIDPAEKDAPDLSVAIDAGVTQGADASAEVEGLTEALNNDKLACSEILALTEQKNEHSLTQVEKIDMSMLNNNEICKVMRWLAKSVERMDALSENVSYEWWSEERRFANSSRKSIVAIMKAEMDKYLAVVNEKKTENAELLKKLNHHEAQLLEANKTSDDAKAEHKLVAVEKLNGLLTQLPEAKKTSEEAMAKTRQLRHKLAMVMEKENEKDGLLEKVNHVEAQLQTAKETSEKAKAETPSQLKDKVLDRHSAVVIEKEEKDRLLEKVKSLEAQLRIENETSEEAMAEIRRLEHKLAEIRQLEHKLAAVVTEKANENAVGQGQGRSSISMAVSIFRCWSHFS